MLILGNLFLENLKIRNLKIGKLVGNHTRVLENSKWLNDIIVKNELELKVINLNSAQNTSIEIFYIYFSIIVTVVLT